MAMPEIMIEIVDLSRSYGPTLALDRVSLQVCRGEVVGFLGPNGAGKTTTMKILAGILAPTYGSVRVAGIDVFENPVEARAQIGFLPEVPPIYGELTVREYLVYLAGLRRVASRDIKGAVGRAMGQCGLVEVSEKLLRNLSKGFKQRAGIAQAIVHNPQVVILDEPTVGLDPIQVREIRELIRELGGERSVLLSTHILPEVQMTCSRVAVIHNGRIVANDTLAGLKNQAEGCLTVFARWQSGPDLAILAALDGVASVFARGDGFVITATRGADPVPDLVRLSVEKQWNLREMVPEDHSLEEIFLHLTTQEERGSVQEEVAL